MKHQKKILNAVKKEAEIEHKHIEIHICDSLKQTIALAKKVAIEGNVVLFSPASASFDMFKNMYDRGDQFRELVKAEK